MSTIQCPGCGGQFPLAQVAQYAQFTCSVCGGTVVVPTAVPVAPPARTPAAAPPAERTAQAARPPSAQRVAAEPRTTATRRAAAAPAEPERARGARRGREAEPASKRTGLLVGGGVGGLALVALIVVLAARGGDAPTSGTNSTSTATAPSGVPATVKEPERDAAAWDGLAPSARADRIAELLALADSADDATLRLACAALKERGADQGARDIATRYLVRNATSPWANDVLGRRELAGAIRSTLATCELALDAKADAAEQLKEMLAEHTQSSKSWWAEGLDREEAEALLEEVVRVNAELENSEAARARAHWVAYQRAIEVMRDYPTVHDHVGPYLIFVQVQAPVGTRVRDAKPEDVANAKKVLAKNVELFRNLYEGWMTEMAPVFGFRRLTADNVDSKSVLKVNVFADGKAYAEFNEAIGSGIASMARAYYSMMEPRFICTYDGGNAEDGEHEGYTNQVQCHEATHQLVHFYTWDTTRTAIDREPPWLDAIVRPLWSTEGFAEFFSSHTVENGTYRWMQPLEERMKQIWIFDEIVEAKGWKPWTLEHLLSIRDGGQLSDFSGARARRPEDHGLATNVMTNFFYADAWSLVYFLWYHGDATPKYRAGLVKYFRREFELDYGQGSGRQLAGAPRPITEKDFFAALGLDTDAQRQALYDEWRRWQTDFVAAHRKPEWDAERTRIRGFLHLDGKDGDGK